MEFYQGGESVRYTTNYSLKKPEISDYVSVDAFNANADVIDRELKAAETRTKNAERVVEITLYASKWSSVAPYSQTVSVPGMKSTDVITVMSAVTASTSAETADMWEKMAGMVKAGIAQNGQATFYCHKKKPTSDFKIKLKGVSST